MIETQTRVITPDGAKYAQQLCKHFAHKITTTFADGHGECRFDAGTAVLDADADGLTITVSASGTEANERLQQVIESHLLRFAFREQLTAIQWNCIQQSLEEGRRGN